MTILLYAALLALFNSARGNATITHGHWLVMVWLITTSPEIMLLTVITTIFPTRMMLPAIDGHIEGVWRGLLRNSPVLLVAWFTGHWMDAVLMLQPVVYYGCGKLFENEETRKAEYVTGLLLGGCLI